MKKRAAIRAGVTISTVVVAIAGATALTTWAKPSPAPFATMSDADLVALADKGELGADADRPYEVAAELWKRRTTMNRQDMIRVNTDARHPQATRSLMIEVLAGPRPDAKADDDARALLDDPRLDGELKARVLASYQVRRPGAGSRGPNEAGGAPDRRVA